jgi:DNA polymerase V
MIAIADCNSFYCSCERLFKPSLIGKPVVVLSNNDGCIVSRTDEAKKLGINMAVPYFECKDIMLKYNVAVFSSNYHLYGDMSHRVMETFRQIMGSEFVEVYSVDESFIDFTHVPTSQYYEQALKLKKVTEQNTGIPICVGVSVNKLLAKVANKLAKKNKLDTKGVKILATQDEIMNALIDFPVEDLWGIGGRYAEKLKMFGIDTAWKLRNLPLEWVNKNLGGVVGVRIVRQLKGEQVSVMQTPRVSKKMIATTRMFGRRVTDLTDIEEAVATYTARAAEKLRKQNGAAGELSVFMLFQETGLPYQKYSVRSSSDVNLLPLPTSDTIQLTKSAISMIRKLFYKGRVYKKAGVILSRIVPDEALQGNLFNPYLNTKRKLMAVMDNINAAYRGDIIKLASAGTNKDWKMRQENRSKKYTTHWTEIPKVK